MNDKEEDQSKIEFEKVGENLEVGFLAEIVGFLKTNKRWWLTPIVLCLLLLGLLLILGGTGAAPFIYTLF